MKNVCYIWYSFFIESFDYQFCEHRIRQMREFFSKQKRSVHATRTQSSTTISFDSFIFQDNLTNSKIVIKDAHKQYHSKQKIKRCKKGSNRWQVEDLKQCIKSYKTTKLFQMDSLRNKLFKTSMHTHNSALQSEHTTVNQSKQGRKIIDVSVLEVSPKELRENINNSNNPVNPQIVRTQTMKDCNVTKSSLPNFVRGSQKKNTVMDSHQTSKIPEQAKQRVLQDEEQLREKVEHYIVNMRNKNSFLVMPDRQHQLYQKLYTACGSKISTIKKKKLIKTQTTQGQQGIFKPIDLGRRVFDLQRKICQKQNIRLQSDEQKQILYAVQHNLFFDLQFLINSRKDLINTRDRMGNNLLHIAAKNRNDSLFLFILKHIRSQALEQKNNLGKTAKDIAKMYGVQQIISLIDNYSPYEYQQALIIV